MATSESTQHLSLLNPNPAPRFIAVVNEDVLIEILLRLPDARAVIQSASVCKHWHSLVINPHFRKRFIEYHSDRKLSDSSILFKFYYEPEVPYYELLLNGLENEAVPYDLSFMPDSTPLEVKAACGDLLLVGRTREDIYHPVLQYYICNSLTKQWFALPEVPQILDFNPRSPGFPAGSFGYALVCDPRSRHRFKALVIYKSKFSCGEFSFRVTVYNSETSGWHFLRLSLPYDVPSTVSGFWGILEIVHTDNGTLHWLDGLRQLNGVAAFDPFTSQFRLIRLPSGGQFTGTRPGGSKDKIRLGVVRGRLRLLLFLPTDNRCFSLKIWELEDDGGDSWNLVRDTSLKTWGEAAENERELFFVLAFDPCDGNVIILVRGMEIYRYNMDRDFHERIREFPVSSCRDCGGSIDKMKDDVSAYLSVSTVVHPFWPTPIPELEHHQT